MRDSIIEVHNIRKVFRIPKKQKDLSWIKRKLSWFYREWSDKVAVDSVSFNVKKGEILGYLGPNGAGKSTTVKMLTGILHPTEGSVSVLNNLDPIKNRKEYTQQIGVVFGQRSILNYDIPVKDSFDLFQSIYQIPEKRYKERLNFLVKLLKIEPYYEVPYRKLSLGEKMRCELAASFIHKPKIVFLDEPTIGLDSQAKLIVRDFLKDINKKDGVTIVITSHDMDDIEELCERIVLIDKGKVYYDGKLKSFMSKYADTKNITVHFKKILDKEKLKKFTQKKSFQKNRNTITFKVSANKKLGEYLSDIFNIVEVIDVEISEPKLEKIIAKVYRENE